MRAAILAQPPMIQAAGHCRLRLISRPVPAVVAGLVMSCIRSYICLDPAMAIYSLSASFMCELDHTCQRLIQLSWATPSAAPPDGGKKDGRLDLGRASGSGAAATMLPQDRQKRSRRPFPAARDVA
jgi:hypothetical protein